MWQLIPIQEIGGNQVVQSFWPLTSISQFLDYFMVDYVNRLHLCPAENYELNHQHRKDSYFTRKVSDAMIFFNRVTSSKTEPAYVLWLVDIKSNIV